jgi:hypothetical protein
LVNAYKKCAKVLQAAGVNVIGYFHTKQAIFEDGVWKQTGFRELGAIKSELNIYKR